MASQTQSRSTRNPDCWYGIEDPAERKKIQNRLAQRARRRRKAGLPTPPCKYGAAASSSESHSSSDESPQELSLTPILERNSPFSSMTGVEIPPFANTPASQPLATEIPPSVFAALWHNGALLGLTCSTVVPAKSRPTDPSIPASLQPTALQLTTVHPIWIDRFPFPKLRDNLILYGGLVDEEEFLRDLFSMESFEILPGKAGWDPGAWKVSGGWRGKWGWLMR